MFTVVALLPGTILVIRIYWEEILIFYLNFYYDCLCNSGSVKVQSRLANLMHRKSVCFRIESGLQCVLVHLKPQKILKDVF